MSDVVITDWTSKWSNYIKRRMDDLSSFNYPFDKSIKINLSDVYSFGKTGIELVDYTSEHPSKSVEYIKDAVIQSGLISIYDNNREPITDSIIRDKVSIRISGIPKLNRLREVRDEDIGKLIVIEGLVKAVTEESMQMTIGAFRCVRCGSVTTRNQDPDSTKVMYPGLCPNCEKKAGFEILVRGSCYEDTQFVSIQELHENLNSGEEPRSIVVELRNDLVGKLNAGDRATFTGEIFRWNKNQNDPVFRRRMKCYDFEKSKKDYSTIEITKEEVREIKKLSKKPNIFTLFSQSIAPTVYGMENAKMALTLQMMGGVSVDYGYERLRGDIHVLFVGEPGIAKSQLGRFITKVSLRGIYTSGKGNSAAGLTATAVKDTIGNGEWMLQGGALVLGDRGHVTIDEFDKMDKNDREILHDALEQQEISIAKAGIVASLKTRCSVLALANPKHGRFDDFSTISDQIDMPPSLISRFDIILVLKDHPNEDIDGKIADRIFDARYSSEEISGYISPDLMMKYISYAKQNHSPKPTDGAKKKLKEYYLGMRSKYKDHDNSSLPVTARQFEALTRLAEASARVRLSDEYDEDDVDRVISIVEASLMDVAKDPDTGEIDIDRLVNKISSGQRGRVRVLKMIIKECASDSGIARWDNVIDVARQRAMSDEHIAEAKRLLLDGNEIYEPRSNTTVKVIE